MIVFLVALIILVFFVMLYTQTQHTSKKRKATMPKWLKQPPSQKAPQLLFFEKRRRNPIKKSKNRLGENC